MTHVLDTHTIIWLLEDSPRLSAAAARVVDDPVSRLIVPSIVVAELWHLYERRRIGRSLAEVSTRLRATSNCSVHPLDETILNHLPRGLEIHDAIIVATAIVYRDVLKQPTTLITRDDAIVKSQLIETLW